MEKARCMKKAGYMMKTSYMMKASYTIEAALLMPIILIVTAWIMKAGITMYQEMPIITESNALGVYQPVDTFRNLALLRNLAE
ncbi:hypothetical protein LQZ18_15160 [Lachnospiraceae bacterium ZAX-1]